MSLHPEPIHPVPAETARVAQAAFPAGHPYLTMRDEFGAFFHDEQFAALFSSRGQAAEAPWRLALVTILQFAEGLSDRQAAEAVRRCIDWKYLLALELTDPGFDFSVLCEFRSRLLDGSQELLLFETLLAHFRQKKLLKARGKQRTDSTHILAAVRALNRLESVGEALRHALNCLAVAAPEWLRALSPPEWVERYGRRFDDERLPEGEAERQALAHTMGADGYRLLSAVYAASAPGWLREIPAVQLLRQVWVQQFYWEEAGHRFRTAEEIPPAAQFIGSPHDPEARYSKKQSTSWVGYKVHFTETCDPDTPLLITDVQTTPATTADGDVTPTIHAALKERDLLPQTHLVDTGFLDAELLVSSREEYQVDLLGPTRPDYHWQAREDQGFAARNFTVHWEEQYAVCPEGKQSTKWNEVLDQRGNPVIKIGFASRDCRVCPSRERCTRSVRPRRTVTVRPEKQNAALQAARQRESTEEFVREYGKRAGVEGTLSQGIRVCEMRRSRYVGLAKTHLQHVITGAALNFVRVGQWLLGTPRARTRESAFVRLMASPA
jgi:transposase